MLSSKKKTPHITFGEALKRYGATSKTVLTICPHFTGKTFFHFREGFRWRLFCRYFTRPSFSEAKYRQKMRKIPKISQKCAVLQMQRVNRQFYNPPSPSSARPVLCSVHFSRAATQLQPNAAFPPQKISKSGSVFLIMKLCMPSTRSSKFTSECTNKAKS